MNLEENSTEGQRQRVVVDHHHKNYSHLTWRQLYCILPELGFHELNLGHVLQNHSCFGLLLPVFLRHILDLTF